MEWNDFVSIISGALVIFLGFRWQKAKAIIKETSEALYVINAAIVDDKITKDEITIILDECRDVLESCKGLLGR